MTELFVKELLKVVEGEEQWVGNSEEELAEEVKEMRLVRPASVAFECSKEVEGKGRENMKGHQKKCCSSRGCDGKELGLGFWLRSIEGSLFSLSLRQI